MTPRSLLVVGAVLASLAWSGNVRAADTFALNWVRQSGAEECVASGELAGYLERMVGPVLRTPSEATLLVEGVATRMDGSGFRAVIRVTDRGGGVIGERELTHGGEACFPLTRSILLVLSVILDPDAGGSLPDDVAAQLSRRENAPAAESVAAFPGLPIADRSLVATPPAPLVATPPPPVFTPVAPVTGGEIEPAPPRKLPPFGSPRVTAAAAAGGGHVPGANLGATVGLGVALGSTFHAALDLWFWAAKAGEPVTSWYATGRDNTFTAAAAIASLCYPLSGGKVEISACAGGMLGARFVNAEALPNAADPTRLYFGPALGAELSWHFNPTFFARATANGGVTVRKDEFDYQTREGGWATAYEPGLVLAWGSLGVGARL